MNDPGDGVSDPAAPGDAPVIRPIAESDWAAFSRIFHEVVDAGDTYTYPAGLDDAGIRALWHEPAPGTTVVAVDERTGTLLGSAKCGPNRPGRGAHVATASFMVAGHARGRGAGRALGSWVIDWARDQGYAAMQFNAVVETNTAAVTLWRSLGFVIVGTVPEAFDSDRDGRVGLHIMHRRLEPPG